MKRSLVYLMSAIVLLTMNSFGEDQTRGATTDASQEATENQGFMTKTSQFFSKTMSQTKRLATDTAGKIKTTFANTTPEKATENQEQKRKIFEFFSKTESKEESDGVFTILKKGDESILVEIDHDSSSYEELVIPESVTSLSCDKRKISIEDEDGKTKKSKLGLFEGLTVERLVFPENCQIKKIDTQCFKGLNGLKELEFRGTVPEIYEEHSVWKQGEDKWRSNLTTITFLKDVPLDRITTISGNVKRLVLGNGVESTEVFRSKNILEKMKKMKKMEEFIIPYSIAQDPEIHWYDIFQQCKGLKNKEIISMPNEENKSILLQAKVNFWGCAEISDRVTHLRAKSVAKAKSIILPLTYETFICKDEIKEGNLSAKNWVLKEKSLQVLPNIVSVRQQGNPKFSSFLAPNLYIQTVYNGLYAGLSVNGEPQQQKIASVRGNLCSSMKIPLDHNKTYAIQFFMNSGLEGKDASLLVSVQTDGAKKTTFQFKTPQKRAWVIKSLLIFLGLTLGIYWLMKFLRCKMPLNSRSANLGKAYSMASGLEHGLFLCACLIFTLGFVGVFGEIMDRILWIPVLQYVNASFLSSLCISCLVTGLQIGVGLLQGLKGSLLVVGIDLAHALAPVSTMLERISMISWLSTIVLLATQFIGEIIRHVGVVIFTIIGAMSILWTFPGYTSFRKLWIVRMLLFIMVGIGVLLPVGLFGCSWFSSQIAATTGAILENALASFRTIVVEMQNMSFSMATVKTCMSLFAEGFTNLITASMGYMVLKLFDCILVPLALLSVILFVLRKIGYKQDLTVGSILDAMTKYERTLIGKNTHQLPEGDKPLTIEDKQSSSVSVPQETK